MPLTPETFQNLERDIEDTGKAVNTDALIEPRYGNPFNSLPRAIRLLMETGGWKAYSTEAELLATVPTVNPSVGYAFDTKKLYKWNGTAWIDEGLSQLDLSKNYFNQNFKLLNSYLSKSTAKNGIFTPIFENEFQTLANTSITDAGIFETTTAYRVLIFPILENDRLKGRIYTGAGTIGENKVLACLLDHSKTFVQTLKTFTSNNSYAGIDFDFTVPKSGYVAFVVRNITPAVDFEVLIKTSLNSAKDLLFSPDLITHSGYYYNTSGIKTNAAVTVKYHAVKKGDIVVAATVCSNLIPTVMFLVDSSFNYKSTELTHNSTTSKRSMFSAKMSDDGLVGVVVPSSQPIDTFFLITAAQNISDRVDDLGKNISVENVYSLVDQALLSKSGRSYKQYLAKSSTRDYSETVEADVVYQVDGTKTTATSPNVVSARFLPCKKGQIFTFSGRVGSATSLEKMMYVGQFNADKTFVSPLFVHISEGLGAVTQVSKQVQATADGYICIRNHIGFEPIITRGFNLSATPMLEHFNPSFTLSDTIHEGVFTDITNEDRLFKCGEIIKNSVIETADKFLWRTYYIPVNRGDYVKFIGTAGDLSTGQTYEIIHQLDEYKNVVSVLCSIVTTGVIVTGTYEAIATQKGFIAVRFRYTGKQEPRVLFKKAFNAVINLDASSQMIKQDNLVISLDGTKTTAAGWIARFIPVKKGDRITAVTHAGDSSTNDYNTASQLDSSLNFIKHLDLYKSSGGVNYPVALDVTATQDGYIYLRGRTTHEINNILKYTSEEPIFNKINDIEIKVDALKNSGTGVKTLSHEFERLPVRSSNDFGYNFVPYAQNNVVEFDDYQYVIVVDQNRSPIIMQRYKFGDWKMFDLSTLENNPFASPNLKDSHNCFVITVTKNGYLLISGNHHNNACRAVISNNPHDISGFTQIKFTTSNIVTYPRFVRYPDGTTQVFWREGISGNGAYFSAIFDDETNLFLEKVRTINPASSVTSNPYEQGIGIGLDGSLHLCWGYRTNGMSADTNFGMFYAKSLDKGVTWTNADASVTYALPLDDVKSEKIFNAAVSSGYCNQNGGCCDVNSRYHTTIWQYDAAGNTQMLHLWFDGIEWQSDVVSDLTFRYDLSGPMVSGDLSRPIIVSTKAGRHFILYHTNNMNRENEIRMIDVTMKGNPKQYIIANFNSRKVELACNPDVAMKSNEIVMLLSSGGGDAENAFYADQPTFLLSSPLPVE
ncbi:BNR-4 repeat-containing protein [Acinetobacter baumannii]|uniref:BNR-4 repeat-containing protein n=1 Tax=Acinetobacter baumannii TaxID=470 RepID=UPI00280D6B95|nr:BNR-4 repeat-containing protein [Acinetobacter baumannii]MDQ8917734.1 BNR-4 repeat-containing protein [Acinetobacter baumannii]MDQ8948591.1 BNR-4 repeat-containing protein [Acinetobacter baumannii]MDQ8962856.1 BNR-4 repeat-containing protein [Acinetobacter baumannii]MDQ8966543.1 BNR-4 repeat-containing protein [Acinetobacter baumannii]MDQ8980452.1 BNR-4 repeat-containing protein [Acinetobacter baumannii]